MNINSDETRMQRRLINQNLESATAKMQVSVLSKREQWLQYAPLIYSYLSIHPIQDLSQIKTVRWLRGPSRNKSTFKFHEGLICVGGARNSHQNGVSQTGIITLYKTAIPKAEQLEDQRLRPILQPKSEATFKEPVKIIEQFAKNDEFDKCLDNFVAVGLQGDGDIYLMSLDVLTDDLPIYSRPITKGTGNAAILKGHSGPISNIKWGRFKTGKDTLFSSSFDTKIYQWDLQKMAVERQMRFHRELVIDICPFNQPLKTIQISQWPNQPQICQNYTLASLGLDGEVLLWDSRNKTPVYKLSNTQARISSISCLSGQALLTGTEDGKVHFWDLRKKSKYTYQSKYDIKEGHSSKVTKLSLNQPFLPTEPKNPKIGKINFTTAANDGKIIQWQDKIQFVHEGHISGQKGENIECIFDRKEDIDIYASASTNQTVLMLWQPGALFGIPEK